jgi:hypothetical protein
MSSEVDICNLALGHLRGGRINSLTESSVQARECKLRYALLRDQMLQDSPWQFAGAIKPLSLLVAELHGWAYVYSYPVDCLRVNRIIPEYEAVTGGTGLYNPWTTPDGARRGYPLPTVEYKVYNLNGAKVIVSNFANLRIDYRVGVTDPTLFSNNFKMALSHLMASEMAVVVAGVESGRALRADSLSMYEKYLNAGVVNELNEQKAEIPESESISVRY